MNAALLVFVLADAVRYAMLAWRKRGVGLSFLRQDAALTLFFFLLIFLFRDATMLLGLTEGVDFWFAPARMPLASARQHRSCRDRAQRGRAALALPGSGSSAEGS